MAVTSKAKKLVESLVVIALAFVLIPVVQSFITIANLTGTQATVAGLVIYILIFAVVLYVLSEVF